MFRIEHIWIKINDRGKSDVPNKYEFLNAKLQVWCTLRFYISICSSYSSFQARHQEVLRFHVAVEVAVLVHVIHRLATAP